VLDVDLEPGDWTLRLVPRAGLEGVAVAALPASDAVVALDVRTTPQLEREGLARDLIRQVQVARKDAGLHVSDRIRLWVAGPPELMAALEAHRATVAAETLAESIEAGEGGRHVHTAEIAGGTARIGVTRAA